jgi:hypothetical protein
MKLFRMSLPFKLFLVCALLAFAPQVHALSITETTGELNVSRWEGTTGPGMPSIYEDIEDTLELDLESLLLYKSDYVPNEEEESGLLENSYNTTYSGDPNNATIRYTGGDFVGPTAYLLVKDGNNKPIWFLFNLTTLEWNGTDDLVLTGFWENRGGAISNVSLYGNTTTAVPEPATMLMLGSGMLGLVLISRKRSKRNKP